MSHLIQHRHGYLLQPAQMPSRCVIAAAAKKQKPKRRKPKQPVSQRIFYDEDDFDEEFDDEEGPASIELMQGSRIPKAPAPKAAPASAAAEPEDLYPVFPKQPKAVERLTDSKWSWGDDAPGSAAAAAQQQAPARMWNPRTGFMRTRAELEQEQEQGASPAGAAAPSGSTAGVQASTRMPPPGSRSTAASSNADQSSSSSSSSSSSRVVERIQESRNPLQPPQLPPSALAKAAREATAAAAAQSAPGELPAASRAQVLTSCALTAAAMSAAALALSVLAAKQSAAVFGTSQETVDQLLQLPLGLQDVQQLGVMLAAAAAVTGARFVLKQQWGDFREATDRSNQQVLSSLGWPDVVLVALLSGVSEELLFRWALISGTWPDARGVLLSGAVFGVLHVSGGRNAAFAAWAAAVGWLYGAAFLVTGNVWVPAGAHALANFASAALWIAGNRGMGSSRQQQS